MKLVLSAILIISAAYPVYGADSSESIITACQTLKRQVDRNKCLEEAVKALAKPVDAAPAIKGPSKKELAAKRSESVFSAATAIQSVIDAGISYNDYQPYIQKFAVELGNYKSSIQHDEERNAADLLSSALEAYGDASAYWRADISFYSNQDYRISYSGSLPMDIAGVSGIVSKYSIPTQKSDIWGLSYGATRGAALSTIWGEAAARISQARTALEFNENVDPSNYAKKQ